MLKLSECLRTSDSSHSFPSIHSQDMEDTICALLLLFVVVRGIQGLNLH